MVLSHKGLTGSEYSKTTLRGFKRERDANKLEGGGEGVKREKVPE